jgi:hypothetical protein
MTAIYLIAVVVLVLVNGFFVAAEFALVAAAAAAHAAGDDGARDDLLGRAGALDREHPSYYGAAWTALGRSMLLGGCRR